MKSLLLLAAFSMGWSSLAHAAAPQGEAEVPVLRAAAIPLKVCGTPGWWIRQSNIRSGRTPCRPGKSTSSVSKHLWLIETASWLLIRRVIAVAPRAATGALAKQSLSIEFIPAG